jgi:hypothetical protein
MKFKGRPFIKQKIRKRQAVVVLVLFIIFIGSTFSILMGVGIYRETVVATRALALPVCLGAIGTALILFFFARVFLNAFFILFLSATIGGGNTYFLTLYFNKLFAASKTNTASFDIKRKGSLASGAITTGRGLRGGVAPTRIEKCRSPYIIIDFNGIQKQLIFHCDYGRAIQTFQKVNLEYAEGFFGYPVIISKSFPDY